MKRQWKTASVKRMNDEIGLPCSKGQLTGNRGALSVAV